MNRLLGLQSSIKVKPTDVGKLLIVGDTLDIEFSSDIGSMRKQFIQPGHGLNKLDVVRIDADGNFKKAIATEAALAGAIGIVEAVSGDTFDVVFGGILNVTADVFDRGEDYYLSNKVEGGMMDIVPDLLIGEVNLYLGTALTEQALYINIDVGHVESGGVDSDSSTGQGFSIGSGAEYIVSMPAQAGEIDDYKLALPDFYGEPTGHDGKQVTIVKNTTGNAYVYILDTDYSGDTIMGQSGVYLQCSDNEPYSTITLMAQVDASADKCVTNWVITDATGDWKEIEGDVPVVTDIPQIPLIEFGGRTGTPLRKQVYMQGTSLVPGMIVAKLGPSYVPAVATEANAIAVVEKVVGDYVTLVYSGLMTGNFEEGSVYYLDSNNPGMPTTSMPMLTNTNKNRVRVGVAVSSTEMMITIDAGQLNTSDQVEFEITQIKHGPSVYEKSKALISDVSGCNWEYLDYTRKLTQLTDGPGTYEDGMVPMSTTSGWIWHDLDVTPSMSEMADGPKNYEAGKFPRSTSDGWEWAEIVIPTVNPVGSVLEWYGPLGSIPTNYITAFGQLLSPTLYPEAYAVYGEMYGTEYTVNGVPKSSDVDGNPSSHAGTVVVTGFRIPDLRGRFTRWVDSGAGIDPDAASRTDRGDGTTGDAVGTLQDDANKEHYHLTEPNRSTFGVDGGVSTATGSTGATLSYSTADRTDVAGGAEARPKNISAIPILKYKNAG